MDNWSKRFIPYLFFKLFNLLIPLFFTQVKGVEINPTKPRIKQNQQPLNNEKLTQNKFSVNTFRSNKMHHKNVNNIWLDQKNNLSTLLHLCSEFSSVSNTHDYLQFMSYTLVHRSPTKSRPLMFFTIQKSMALNSKTRIKVNMLKIKLPRIKYLNWGKWVREERS